MPKMPPKPIIKKPSGPKKIAGSVNGGTRVNSPYTEKGVYISEGGTVFEPYSKKKMASDAIVKPTIKKKAAAKKTARPKM